MSQPLIFEVEVDARAAAIQVESPKVTVAPSDPRVIFAVSPGAKGEPGPPGEGVQAFGETPAGAINGTNVVFTTADPFRPDTTAVYLNGLREDHYSETGVNQITFEDPPTPGDKIRIDYILQG